MPITVTILIAVATALLGAGAGFVYRKQVTEQRIAAPNNMPRNSSTTLPGKQKNRKKKKNSKPTKKSTD